MLRNKIVKLTPPASGIRFWQKLFYLCFICHSLDSDPWCARLKDYGQNMNNVGNRL